LKTLKSATNSLSIFYSQLQQEESRILPGGGVYFYLKPSPNGKVSMESRLAAIFQTSQRTRAILGMTRLMRDPDLRTIPDLFDRRSEIVHYGQQAS
jgi:hypothetical protein